LGWKQYLQYGDYAWKPEGKGPFGRPGQNGDKIKVAVNDIKLVVVHWIGVGDRNKLG
jgi:hypothetical protein